MNAHSIDEDSIIHQALECGYNPHTSQLRRSDEPHHRALHLHLQGRRDKRGNSPLLFDAGIRGFRLLATCKQAAREHFERIENNDPLSPSVEKDLVRITRIGGFPSAIPKDPPPPGTTIAHGPWLRQIGAFVWLRDAAARRQLLTPEYPTIWVDYPLLLGLDEALTRSYLVPRTRGEKDTLFLNIVRLARRSVDVTCGSEERLNELLKRFLAHTGIDRRLRDGCCETLGFVRSLTTLWPKAEALWKTLSFPNTQFASPWHGRRH